MLRVSNYDVAYGQSTIIRNMNLKVEENEIVVQARSTRILAENFRKFTENINLEKTIQTLIAVA